MRALQRGVDSPICWTRADCSSLFLDVCGWVQREWYRSQLSSNDTRYTRALLGVLCILWILGILFGAHSTSVFALTPGLIFSNYRVWTFFTAGLFETSVSMGAINISVYLLVAPMLERAWGSYSFAKFVAVSNLCSMVAIFFSMVACYAATEFEPCLFNPVCGFSGVNAAFAVALKQKFGEKSVITGVRFVDSLRFKHLPMLLGWLSLLLWITGRLGGKEAPLVFFGTFFSWVYLRFFMWDASTGVVGDLRPEFGAATFFPDWVPGVRGVVEGVGTVVFQAAWKMGFFAEAVRTNASLPVTQPTTQTEVLGAGLAHGASTLGSASGSDLYRSPDPTSERRRLLAIKAIDDKLAELARQPNNNMMHGYAPDMHTTPAQSQATLPMAHDSALSPEAAAASTSPAQLAQASSALVDAALPSEEEMAQMEAALAKPAQQAPATN